jgi:hypothetical protein
MTGEKFASIRAFRGQLLGSATRWDQISIKESAIQKKIDMGTRAFILKAN